MSSNDTPKLISIKKAADMLCVTPLTLRNWDRDGKLKAMRHPLNNYRVYKREDIEKFIAGINEHSGRPVEPRKPRQTGPRKIQVRHEEE